MDNAALDWASSGVVALTGRSNGPPHVPPGRAASVAAELARRFTAMTGVEVDGPALLAERAAITGHTRHGSTSVGGAARLLPTADGWAAVSWARPDDRLLLSAMIGSQIDDDPWPAVADWLCTHLSSKLAERAALLGITACPVPATPLSAPRAAAAPGAAVDLNDALVVDFSALWAGPLAAHLLGLAGARVIKVETLSRPDGARRGASEFYRLLHAGHATITVDPQDPTGRRELAGLVAAADVVVEASRPRALAGFGLDADEVVARGTTWLSITAWGRADSRVGFGDDVAAGAGLVARDRDGSPLFCGDALADPLTGLSAALAAVEAPGRLHDVAMGPTVASTLDGSPGGPARRADNGWVIDTAIGAVPVAPPRRRRAVGSAPRAGTHTGEVRRDLGAGRPRTRR